MNTKPNFRSGMILSIRYFIQYLHFIVLFLMISCNNEKRDEDVILKMATNSDVKVGSAKIRIHFSDSMNIDLMFINGKRPNYLGDSNTIETTLKKGYCKLLIQKKDNSLVKTKIKANPGMVYFASYVHEEEVINREERKTDDQSKKKVDSIGDTIVFIFFIGIFLIWLIASLTKSSENDMAIIALVVAGLGLSFGLSYAINTSWVPYLAQLFIFVPGLYALCVGVLGSINEGNQTDTTHEWRYVKGGRIGPASIKTVYEHQHGSGSWSKKLKRRKMTALVLGLIIAVIIVKNITENIGLFNLGFWFTISILLGILNFTAVFMLIWNGLDDDRKLYFYSIMVLNLAGCVLSICFFNNVIYQLVFQILLYIVLTLNIILISIAIGVSFAD
jgi:hypothetical protein